MKVVVTGGRYYSDRAKVEAALDAFDPPISVLLAGDATGADKLAIDWAVKRSVDYHCYVAQWTRYGNRAGPMRNKRMIDEKPYMVIAFPGDRGTANCVKQAKEAGIPVKVIR